MEQTKKGCLDGNPFPYIYITRIILRDALFPERLQVPHL